MHSPTVRKSCQPSDGPMGLPVDARQIIVDARCVVMPTAVTGPEANAATATR